MPEPEPTRNISTVSRTESDIRKLDAILKGEGFRGRSHFFDQCIDTLFEQKDAGKKLEWPYGFKEKKKAPTKTAEPKSKRSKKKPI